MRKAVGEGGELGGKEGSRSCGEMSAWFPPLALEVAALIAAVSAMVPLEVFALGLESFYGGPQAVLRLYGDRDLGQRVWHPEARTLRQNLNVGRGEEL